MRALIRRLPCLAPLALLAAVAAPAAAQGGGFLAGDMYHYSPFLDGLTINSGGVLRIDPATGTANHHFVFDHSIPQTGMIAFDPYRQRLLVGGNTDGAGQFQQRLFLVDGAGAAQDNGLTGLWRSFAPVGDGRVYFQDQSSAIQPFKWLDAANREHVLMDATGTLPFKPSGSNLAMQGMIYDPATNSLLAGANFLCSGTQTFDLAVRRMSLSADGSRVLSEACDSFFVDSSAAAPCGLSRNAAGQTFLVCDTNQPATAPRMTLVDASVPDIAAFASNGAYSGPHVVSAGAWSSRVGKLIITDLANNMLRGYSLGDVGAGSFVVTVSEDFAKSSEAGTLIDIPFSDDSGGWIAYGAGLAGAGGRVPGLWGTGNPEPGEAFALHADEIVGGASGVLFVGLASAATPFKGGTFHVGALALTVSVAAGGAAGVPGAGTLLLPAALPADPALSGVSLYLQAGFGDAAAAKGASLTQGLRMEIG